MSTTTVAPPRSVPTDGRGGRGRRRTVWAWAVVVAIAIVVGGGTALAGSAARSAPAPLDPDSTTGTGSRALVEVLRQRGTDVRVVRSTAEVRSGTVFVDDSDGALTPANARRVAARADHVVLVADDPAVIRAFGLRADPVGTVRGGRSVDTADCAIDAVARAGSVTLTGSVYAVDGDEDVRCAPSGTGPDRGWGLVRAETDRGDVTLVGTTAALQNGTITDAGNAALALGLLGAEDRLTWFVATPGDATGAPSLGAIAPGWVPSALVLLGVVAFAAAVWRGRRLGPLVVESMPVVVRAAETTEGRARLYARARDRTHALDTLRVAALRRIGRRLGLPRSAHVDAVVHAAAAATGRPPAEVGAVLVGGPVDDDRTLVAVASAIDGLEQAVARATAGDPPPQATPKHTPGGRP